MVFCKSSATVLFFASAFLCSSAVAQGATPQTAHSSNSARTPSESTSAAAQSPPDIFSPSYVPPKSKPREISVPKLVYSVDPQYPAHGPKGKFSGIAVVALLVGTDGKPEQVHVVKSLGPGFDKAAVAAVAQYRFKPALKNGTPVPVKVNVEVSFRRY